MKEEKNEFLGILCNLYIVVLLVALPLYTRDGYWRLDEIKYTLFHNLSFLCLGGWLIAGMPGRVRAGVEAAGAWKRQRQADGKQVLGGSSAISGMDCVMLVYGACVVLSAVFSAYGKLAWVGYGGWYMGAVSQLLFVGIYFFVSRQYNGAGWPLYLGEAAFFLVTLLGLLHRLGIDPLGLMTAWNSRDWEYSHMLSTLGNINWLCGYYSVALAFVIAHFLQAKKRWMQAVLYPVSVAAFVLLCIQGSQSGLLILVVCVAVCLFWGIRERAVWRKIFLVLAGNFAALPLMEVLMKLRGEKAAVVADGNIYAVTSWYGWLLAAVGCLFLFFLSDQIPQGKEHHIFSRQSFPGEFFPGKRCEKTSGQKEGAVGKRKAILAAVLLLFCCVGVLTVSWFLYNLDDGFGSGRGFLWRIAVEGFQQAEVKDKLIGAGPDCYGEAVFLRLGAGTEVWDGEHWEGAVFTNAHNEILSQLCNVGILGTVSYLAIFLVGLWKYGSRSSRNKVFRRLDKTSQLRFCEGGIGVLALAMYGIHSLVSFQQVLNAPLLFLVLGLCEAEMRSRGRGICLDQRGRCQNDILRQEEKAREESRDEMEEI